MKKNAEHKELDTYAELFGKRYHVVLLNNRSIDSEEASKLLIKALQCDTSYAQDCLYEAYESGEANIYTSHLERCELIHEILKKDDFKLSTKVIKD